MFTMHDLSTGEKLDQQTALDNSIAAELRPMMQVWECDDYTWVMAGNRDDAYRVYMEYIRECHGDNPEGLNIAGIDDIEQLSPKDMGRYRYQLESGSTVSYEKQLLAELAKDCTTPRLFAVGE